ncbi:MAG: hypothetical protein Q9171_001941, partial [Xanthocarpia ochracea]
MSHAQTSTAPIVLSHILISFSNGLKDIKVEHQLQEDPLLSTSGNFHVFNVALRTEIASTEPSSPTASSLGHLLGNCDLTFSPGTTKAISLDLIPKDAGIVRVSSITSTIKTDSFTLDHVVSEAVYMRQEDIWLGSTKGTSRRAAGNEGSNEIRIHPKPPKVHIELSALRKEYLTDESVRMDIEITNEEDDDAEVTLEARFLGQADLVPVWTWITDEASPSSSEDPLSNGRSTPLSTIILGRILQSARHRVQATFTAKALPTEAVLEVKALYHILREPDTPISKVIIHDVIFERPFEANFDFQPCVDTKPWPSYFYPNDVGDDEDFMGGLRQVWHSNARLTSFATEPLIIENVTMEVLSTHEGATCEISNLSTTPSSETTTITPNDLHETHFQIIAQKADLDDRRPATIQSQSQVRWRRKNTDAPAATATTILSTPDLLIPFGEPRVLASAGAPHPDTQPIIIPLSYTLENPSTHVLNFDLSMETSEDFAFSGPKTTTVTLVPVSRKT